MIEQFMDFFKLFPEFNASLGAGSLIFMRFMGFMALAPIFSRKDVPIMIKVSFALFFTILFVGLLQPEKPPEGVSLILSGFLNISFGAVLGMVANMILSAVQSGGDIINMQMGLSASVMFDQSTKEQTSGIGKFFNFFGTIIFLNMGGFYWLIQAFQKTFTIFPIYNIDFPLSKIVNVDYLVLLTSNVMFVGLQFAAPVFLATLIMDVILGVISKTAPQINVFQLSFMIKPLMGIIILIVTLPTLINVIADYFLSYSSIF